MKSLTVDELNRLLAVAHRHSERDWLLFKIMFNHAMRVTEVVGGWLYRKDGMKYWHDGLTAKNIVDDYLVAPRLKGSRRIEHPLLPDEKDAVLKLVIETPSGRLFPMSRKTAWLRIKKYGAEAGIPAPRIFNHALKHTAGRLGYKGGMTVQEIQEYMGHVNVNNSLIYSRATPEEAAQAFAQAIAP
jgi:type 1 fimbriae regulatory protein FimB